MRCVLYLRISLDRTGEGLAIERQRAECERIARARGWTVIREYVDDSISAYKGKKRDGYEQMLADWQHGEFDAVIVWAVDRLTRRLADLVALVDLCERTSVKIVTVSGDLDLSTASGRLVARILGSVAQGEVETKSGRQVAAARQRAELGRMPIGVRAFGYTTGEEVIEAEAAIVAEMFARFHAGDSLVGIARWLNASGVPTRHGAPWRSGSVRQILLNPRYAGRVIYKHRTANPGPPVPATFPAIVDEAVWDAVNDRLADPRRKTAFGTDRKHLGSSVYQCGACGKRVRSHGSPLRYRCPDGHVTRSAAGIDEWVTAHIRERLSRPDVSRLVAVQGGSESTTVTAEIRKLRGRLKRTEQDYDQDLIDGRRYREKRAKIEAAITEAEARRARLMAGSEVAGVLTAPDPVRAFDDAPLGVQQSVIRFFCEVELLHVARGVKGFNPDTVRITPRQMS